MGEPVALSIDFDSALWDSQSAESWLRQRGHSWRDTSSYADGGRGSREWTAYWLSGSADYMRKRLPGDDHWEAFEGSGPNTGVRAVIASHWKTGSGRRP